MSQKIKDEESVSQAYQRCKQADSEIEPPSRVDLHIKQAAAGALQNKQHKSNRSFLIPVSIAASVLLASVVVLKVSVLDPTQQQQVRTIADIKKPMFMLQRSKPGSVESMTKQLNYFLDQGEIDKARQLHKKLRYYFPEYQLDSSLMDKLRSENII